MKNKTNLSILLIIIGFLIFFSSYAQNNNVEKEKKLVKKWQLISDAQCDRCHDYIPTGTLIATFNNDHTCSGVIIGRDEISTANWELIDNKLIITYYGKQKIYKLSKLDDTSLVLWQDTFGGTSRKFKAFN